MKALVGISCCNKFFGPSSGLLNHAASDLCVRAVCDVAGAIPILLPATGNEADTGCLLDRLDGILLTGSRSNIAPTCYGGAALAEGSLQDPARDATTLPLIRAAIARGVPVLAICRGMQEMNVALGGTLFQHLPALPGRLNHAAAQPEDKVGRVAPAHSVKLTQGGLLHRLAQASAIDVNSLHFQAIDRLAEGLMIEAEAPDGTIEAVRTLPGHGFAVGVQWHPEFDATSNPISAALFQAFGQAMLHRHDTASLAAD